MKHLLALALLFASARPLSAGESHLTTYQPLCGLGSAGIVIAPVVCHDWYAHSGQPTAIGLITARNVPPTNNPKQATEDLNLASVCGVKMGCGDMATTRELTLDVTAFAVPGRFGNDRGEVIRACLECLRRCLPKELLTTPVTLKAKDADKAWLTEIVQQFNAHDRSKVFFTPRE